MHEISLVAELVEVCLDRVARSKRPVTVVRVRHATTVPADGLRQAFEMLTRDTPLAGVTLDAEPFDQVLDCPRCGEHSVLGHDDVAGAMAVCPRCDEVAPIPHAAELELLELRSAG